MTNTVVEIRELTVNSVEDMIVNYFIESEEKFEFTSDKVAYVISMLQNHLMNDDSAYNDFLRSLREDQVSIKIMSKDIISKLSSYYDKVGHNAIDMVTCRFALSRILILLSHDLFDFDEFTENDEDNNNGCFYRMLRSDVTKLYQALINRKALSLSFEDYA